MPSTYTAQEFTDHVDRARELVRQAADQERDHRLGTLAEALVHATLAQALATHLDRPH
jgi:hypothetical protein